MTQYGYNAAGLAECVAVRMNGAAWGSLPASACSLGTTGGEGPDRITRTSYDNANRATLVQTAYGTADQADELTTSYNANGTVASVTDGNGNKTTYEYDGVDRLVKTRYPVTTTGSGTSSTTDYEQLGYDPAGNVTSRRLRDGQTIGFTYDNLNRATFKNLPGSEPDVTYSYDLTGYLTGASQSGPALTCGYDALRRRVSQTGPRGTTSTGYDLTGQRMQLTYDGGFYVNYDRLVTGEVTAIRENGATSGAGVLASYGYDQLGRRTSVTRGNGTATSYGYDNVSRLASLTQDLAGTSGDLALGFGYNKASQIASVARSNDAYAWTGAATGAKAYGLNGLNQMTSAAGVSITYDARGNTASIGGSSYGYSSENLLTSAPGGVTLGYDPLMRLYTTSGSGMRFRYDGVDLIGEVDGSGVLQKRYVHGDGDDEPVVEYVRNGSGSYDRVWLHADERGSVVARSDASGAAATVNSYDEYGVPGSGNAGRFQYTGQAWLPDVGLYYYKARMLAAQFARFMQTDPIGYGSGPNWYGYVANDPVNYRDPLGLLQTSPYDPCPYGYICGPDGSVTCIFDWVCGIVVEGDPNRLDFPRYIYLDPLTGDLPLWMRDRLACTFVNDWCGGLVSNPGADASHESEPTPCPNKPLPPATRTYPIPKGYTASSDKQNRFVNQPGKHGLQINPLYAQAMRETGGTDWKGVAVDLLKIAGSVAFVLRAGEIGGSLFAWDVPDVTRAAGIVGSSGVKATVDVVDGNQCRR